MEIQKRGWRFTTETRSREAFLREPESEEGTWKRGNLGKQGGGFRALRGLLCRAGFHDYYKGWVRGPVIQVYLVFFYH